LIAHHLPVSLLIGGQGLVSCHSGSGVSVEQFLRSLELNFAQGLPCLASLERSFGRSNRCLEQSLLDAVERRAFLDQVAFLEKILFEISGDTRPDFHTLNGLDTADKYAGSFNGLALRRHRANGDYRGCGPLSLYGCADAAEKAERTCKATTERNHETMHGPTQGFVVSDRWHKPHVSSRRL
jgi:hypothetical protein